MGRRYREALEKALREGVPEVQWERAIHGIVISGKDFTDRMRSQLDGSGDWLRKPLTLEELEKTYCEPDAEEWEEIGEPLRICRA